MTCNVIYDGQQIPVGVVLYNDCKSFLIVGVVGE
jgi:hypothetical protein